MYWGGMKKSIPPPRRAELRVERAAAQTCPSCSHEDVVLLLIVDHERAKATRICTWCWGQAEKLVAEMLADSSLTAKETT